jgi:hypothetical protein
VLNKSLIVLFLSIPASVAIIGVVLAIVPPDLGYTLPMLLLFYPLWTCVACGSYFFRNTTTAAALLSAISGVGFGLIAILKFVGITNL